MDNEVTKAEMSISLRAPFAMRELAYFNLCKHKQSVTSAQYFTAFIKHKHWI